ncbi:outward-rectifier potassium channel TOK1 [Rhypophila decipiens]
MNDASGDKLDDHVKAEEDGAAGTQLPKEEEQEQDRQDHLDPSRWWFASAAFPMIAGTLGPVASAFSICALVRPWRQTYGPGTDITNAPFIPDPGWLTIINAVQLVIALLANFALLLNMTRRLRFSIAQPVTIAGWYVSSVTLVALTATAAGPLVIEPQDRFVWSQAFYYGIYSAVLYFAVASLMLVTFLGAQAGRYEKDFMLTPSQRTLMLQTISFLIYILLGSLVFSHIEDWNYLDAMYWAAVTLFTVGFGDIYPETILGRALLFPYALVGIISLGLVIGSIRSLILQRGKHRLDARMMERKRRKMLRRMTRKGEDDILVPIRDESKAPSLRSADATGLTEFERREQEFKLMRTIQHAAARRRRWYALAVSGGTWLVLWLVGAKIFQEAENKYQGWTYFDGVYFAFVSLTTIGYGDITPVSNAGRSFWVFWAFLALPTTTVLISNAGDTVVKFIRDTTDQIATITILPGERGFKKDFRMILRKLSCGTLFDEDIEETPPGFFGDLPTNRAETGDTDDEDDEVDGGMETSLRQNKLELDAEAAGTAAGRVHKANEERDEGTHNKRVDANAKMENHEKPSDGHIRFDDESPSRPRTANSSSTKSLQNHPHHLFHNKKSPKLPKMSRAVSFPRQVLPEIPANKADYHVTLIEEIGRVMQHLKSHPPRKYTFQEWAWYLRLIGEDEGNADRHRKVEQPHLHLPNFRQRKKAKEVEKDIGGHVQEGEESGEPGEAGDDGKRKPWSWVGTHSPLMGSQEEAEWILEKLTERLKEELSEDANYRKRGQRRRSTVGDW